MQPKSREKLIHNIVIAKIVRNLHFIFSSFTGFEKIVQLLIERGANVNAIDGNSDSALIIAANKGNISNIFDYIIGFDFALK